VSAVAGRRREHVQLLPALRSREWREMTHHAGKMLDRYPIDASGEVTKAKCDD